MHLPGIKQATSAGARLIRISDFFLCVYQSKLHIYCLGCGVREELL